MKFLHSLTIKHDRLEHTFEQEMWSGRAVRVVHTLESEREFTAASSMLFNGGTVSF